MYNFISSLKSLFFLIKKNSGLFSKYLTFLFWYSSLFMLDFLQKYKTKNKQHQNFKPGKYDFGLTSTVLVIDPIDCEIRLCVYKRVFHK